MKKKQKAPDDLVMRSDLVPLSNKDKLRIWNTLGREGIYVTIAIGITKMVAIRIPEEDVEKVASVLLGYKKNTEGEKE